MRKFLSKICQGKIEERINEINTSFPNKKNRQKFIARFAELQNDTLYKHIPDYAKVKLGKKVKEEDYIVNVGVWQEYLVKQWLERIDLNKIEPTERSGDIFMKNRAQAQKGKKDKNTENTEEESAGKKSEKIQCKTLMSESKDDDALGKIWDFQVPLKARKKEQKVPAAEHKGELDLVAVQGNTMVLVEYKIPDSTEPLLRAVLEAITYFYQIGGGTAESKYLRSFNDVFKDNLSGECDSIGIAIVVPEVAYRYGHERAFKLIKDYHIACYTFEGEDFRNIVRLSNEKISEYEKEAKIKLAGIYDNSELIVSKIKLI